MYINRNILASIFITAPFAAAALLVFYGDAYRLAGATLAIAGVGAVAFRRQLAKAENATSEKPYGQGTPRPLTIMLWGVWVTIIGLSLMFL